MRIEICKFIMMCLSIFLWASCGNLMKYKKEYKAEIFATALVSFVFDFWTTFG